MLSKVQIHKKILKNDGCYHIWCPKCPYNKVTSKKGYYKKECLLVHKVVGKYINEKSTQAKFVKYITKLNILTEIKDL